MKSLLRILIMRGSRASNIPAPVEPLGSTLKPILRNRFRILINLDYMLRLIIFANAPNRMRRQQTRSAFCKQLRSWRHLSTAPGEQILLGILDPILGALESEKLPVFFCLGFFPNKLFYN